MPKCQYCEEQGEKELMHCDEKPTGNFNKNGSEKMNRKYYHDGCYSLQLKKQDQINQDLKELDELYLYLKELHGIQQLDGRMMEKIQDLRNGTVKVNNRKITKYKQGVTYMTMLETYKFVARDIDNAFRGMSFATKWNEFSYGFGITERNINEYVHMQQRQATDESKKFIVSDAVDIEVKKVNKKNKKDELDISAFL